MSTADKPQSQLFLTALKSTALYALTYFGARALSILLMPVYTRHLSPADYGVMELLDMLATGITLTLTFLRIGGSLFVFYHQAPDRQSRDGFVFTALTTGSVAGVVVTAAVHFFAGPFSQLVFNTAEYAHYVQLFSLSLFGTFVSEVGISYLRVTDRPGLLSAIQLARLAIQATLNIVLLVWQHMGVAAMLWSGLLTSTGAAVVAAYFILREVRPRLDAGAFRKMVKFSYPFMFGAFAEFVLNMGDRYFLRSRVSLAELGIYGVGYKFGMIISSLASCFFLYWDAQVVSIGRRQDAGRVISRAATYYFGGLVFATLAISVLARPMLTLFADRAFHGGAAYVPWIAAAYAMRGLSSFFTGSFLITNRPSFVAKNQVAAMVVCLAGYVMLIPAYRLWGAIASSVIGLSSMVPLGYMWSQRLYPVAYEYGRLARVVAAAVIAGAVFALVSPVTLAGQLGIASLAIALFAGLLAASGFVQEDEKELAMRAWQKLRQRPA